MLKQLCVAAIVLAAGSELVIAGEMPMQGSARAGSADVDTAVTVRDDVSASPMRAPARPDESSTAEARTRAPADIPAEARNDTPRNAVGTDATTNGDAAAANARRPHHRAHWQSLLPGVMK
ncbi:MAG TPA: hypothetical protein VFB32_10510 [Rudaea sp.]|nr:hypothetical protein [Rudaea sp.]